MAALLTYASTLLVVMASCSADSNDGEATGSSLEALSSRPPLKGVGNNGSPKDVFPLAICRGDCDNDNECQSGLVCFQRDPNESVPGCAGGSSDTSKTDYCIKRSGSSNTTPPTEGKEGDNSGGSSSGGGSGELWIIVFAVGSGDSSLIVFPTGKTMLIDTGIPTRTQDVVIPFLKKHNIDRLDYLVVTHEHPDHGGWSKNHNDSGPKVLERAGIVRSSTVRWDWKTHHYGKEFNLEGTKWFIYNSKDGTLGTNDTNFNSLSYRIEYNGFVYTGTGDEGPPSMKRFLKDHPAKVRAHVRNTAHHMYGPYNEDFLRATDPVIVLISNTDGVRDEVGFATLQSAIKYYKENNKRFKRYYITGDSDVGHVVIRVKSSDDWSHRPCGRSSCEVPEIK